MITEFFLKVCVYMCPFVPKSVYIKSIEQIGSACSLLITSVKFCAIH